MASSRILISSQTLTSSAASVTFSSIPATYTDLCVKLSNKNSDTGTGTWAGYFTFNGTGGTAYSDTYLLWSSGSFAPGSGRSSNTSQIQTLIENSSNAAYTNNYSNTEIYIPSYTASQNKPVSTYTIAEMNNTNGTDLGQIDAGLWRNTAAITSITFYPVSGSYVSGSSFYLYGIKNS
jgi:hypothetical protein